MKINKTFIVLLITFALSKVLVLASADVYNSVYNRINNQDSNAIDILKEKGDELSQDELDILLSAAVRIRNLELVNELFSLGANPNGNNGQALIFAFMKKDGISEAFLDNNADLTLLNIQLMGVHPLEFAVSQKDIDLLTLLLDNGVDLKYAPEALRLAIESGDPRVVEFLLNRGANPNAPVMRQGAKSLPLILAIGLGKTDIVKLLLKYGADTSKIPSFMRSSLPKKEDL